MFPLGEWPFLESNSCNNFLFCHFATFKNLLISLSFESFFLIARWNAAIPYKINLERSLNLLPLITYFCYLTDLCQQRDWRRTFNGYRNNEKPDHAISQALWVLRSFSYFVRVFSPGLHYLAFSSQSNRFSSWWLSRSFWVGRPFYLELKTLVLSSSCWESLTLFADRSRHLLELAGYMLELADSVHGLLLVSLQ